MRILNLHISLRVLALLLMATGQSTAQFKNDNVKFKTVFMEDLCAALAANPGYFLLDARNRREHGDSSKNVTYNMGRLKNAVNIDYQELGKRLGEIKSGKNDPIFVYCAHSAASRWASATLADNGYTNVFNINGGMSRVNLLKDANPCLDALFETENKFNLVSPHELLTRLKNDKNLVVVDVRKDSVFRGTSSEEKFNAYGAIKGAINIPGPSLEKYLNKIPKQGSIVIVDDGGVESRTAAMTLINNGYNNVGILFYGMAAWAEEKPADMPGREKFWNHPAHYGFLTADDFDSLARKVNVKIVDVRSADEFANRSKMSSRNKGNIKGAVNIPYTELAGRLKELEADKGATIVVHHYSNDPDSFRAARLLADAGYKKVYVLIGGLNNLRWRAANVKGKAYLNDWVENVPAENL